MKFGVREICDVVLRAKSAMKIGNKVFYKNEPVLYFDTLKTSVLENATNTVYAQGGRGNARLIAWEGEKTITFTMEDALISPIGLSVLTGAGLVKAEEKSLIVHKTEITNRVKPYEDDDSTYLIEIKEKPFIGEPREKDSHQQEGKIIQDYLYNSKQDFIYVMLLDDSGEVISEPYIASEREGSIAKTDYGYEVEINSFDEKLSDDSTRENDLSKFYEGCSVLVDYYTEVTEKAYQVNITPEDFSGNFYLEASTLFRASNGVDMPAEFIIPNCKIQSNFTFTMASSGDPTTFNFVIDAFPDYTRWNKDKKVFAVIQVIEQNEIASELERLGTPHNYQNEKNMEPFFTYKKEQEQYIADEPEEFLNDILTSIDEKGKIYNDGLGYKKNYILDVSSTPNRPIETPMQGYTITGSIPCQTGQVINIIGFNNEDNNKKYQKIFFYDGANGNLIGNRCYEPPADSNNISYDTGANEELDPGSLKYIRICFYNTDISEMAVLVSNPISSKEKSNNNLQFLSLSPNLNLQSNNDEEEPVSPEEEVSNLTDEDLDISDIISLLEEE